MSGVKSLERRWEALTEDTVCSEAGFESPDIIGRKCVRVREEPCHERVRERPRYESDATLLIPIRVDTHWRDLLLAD
jgi:hypothetical protein